MVSDALDKGAEAVVGGAMEHEMGPNFFHPTLLTGCNHDMRVSTEEIFGPVVGVRKFSTDEEALDISNRYEPTCIAVQQMHGQRSNN